MKRIRIIGGLLIFLWLLGTASFAVLTVNFDESLPVGQVSYYWSTDAKGANLAGRTINPDPSIATTAPYFVMSDDDRQACAGTAPPTTQFVFGSDVRYPASENISIRVWDTTERTAGDTHHYTNLLSFPNPGGATSTVSQTITYRYVALAPDQPIISSLVIASTSDLTDDPVTTTGSHTFHSEQPERTAPNLIEAGTAEWRYREVGASSWTTSTGNTLTLRGSAIATPGVQYEIQVQRTNVWGTSPWSDTYIHTIGAGPDAGAGTLTTEFSLVRPADSLGINVITFPFSSVTDPSAITNVSELVQAVNTLAGRNAVTTVSWWNNTEQAPAGYIVTYTDATVNRFGTITNLGSANADWAAQAIVRDASYQLYVTEGADIDVRMIGTR